MNKVKTAQVGIEQSQQDQVSKKLLSVYCEREALINQIRAAQWNTQDKRAAEFIQMLSAATPETQQQQRHAPQQRNTQAIQAFAPSTEIAERISVNGYTVPSNYTDLQEYSDIQKSTQGTTTQENAGQLATACEQFAQTTRTAIQAARQANDEVTVQALADQLRPAELLATQLKRFQ